MITTYLRSSSYGAYDFCEHKYFLNYVLGLEEDSNKKAEHGNMLHKVAECLALGKKIEQETGDVGGYNIGDNYIGEFVPNDIRDNSILTPLCKLAFNYYSSISTHEWTQKDLVELRSWIDKVVTIQNGQFDPRNKQIVDVEKYFDFEIKQDWAKYKFELGDKTIEGNLSLKGTMDLVMEIASDHYEILDYKTGQRKNWATGKVKELEDFQKDPQLLIYYYACRNIYPDIKYFDFTIYFVNQGGPFTVCFDDNSYELAENLIRKRFQKLVKNKKPTLLEATSEGRSKNFKCTKLCHFFKNNYPGSDKTICEYFKDKVETYGADLITEKYGNLDKISQYGDGGGRKKEI